MRTHFVREYFCENQQIRETAFVCSYGAQVCTVDVFDKKNPQQSRNTASLNR